VLTNTLYANTTINSLSFSETGTGTNTGITIMGDTLGRQLVLNSGTIWVRQAVASAVPSDAITITNLTLDLNGREGVFFIATTGLNQGNTPAPLYINCVITNDGGNGITINGNNGEIILSGNTTNRYTGATTVNSGILRLNKAVQNTGIPGDLVMNGGTLLTAVESVPDTADVTLNGGSFYFDSTTSSGNGGRQETIRNFTMNGGTLNYNSGTDSRFYINGNATINAGDLRHNTGGDVTVRGTTTLNGGRVLVSYASSTNSANALFTLNTLAITNLVSGGYTGIAFRAHNTNKGGLLTLTGDVAVVCNSINTNSVFFESENAALTNQGAIALSDLRTFDIGDGAAANDLVIVPAITNAAIIGALVKAGAGTLALNGASTYTGPTSVTNGTLLVNGGLVSPVTVWDGAVLGGTGRITTNATAVTVKAGGSVNPGTIGGVGTLTVTGAVDFASGSVLAVDLSGATADRLAVSGNVTGSGPVQVSVTTTNKGAWLIMTAANIAPAFTTDAPGLVVTKKENDTQLWLQTPVGTRIIVR
jgi:autotransporter-associated beta strand protein